MMIILKDFKRSLTSVMILVLVMGLFGTSASASSLGSNENDEDIEEMVDVTISSSDGESIVAEVPKSYEQE